MAYFWENLLPAAVSAPAVAICLNSLISRERVPQSNTGKYKERGNSDPKNMSPRDRIEEFPREICVFEVENCFAMGVRSMRAITF